MRTWGPGRARTALLLAGLMGLGTWAAAGPAAASEDRQRPTTAWWGSTFVGSGGDSGSEDVFADVGIYDPPDQEPFGNAEFFVLGYDCVTEDTVPARFDGLRSASARGTLALDCWWHGDPGHEGPQHVTGTARLALEWEGEGRTSRRTLAEPGDPCVYRFLDRHAEVSGRAVVTIPELSFRAVATPLGSEFDHLTRERAVCR